MELTIGRKMKKEKDFARNLAYEVGELLLDYWPGRKGAKELAQESKSDGSLLTEADTAANTLILQRLQESYPEDGILSEESEDIVGKTNRLWVIDPLDGTARFAGGHDDFNILIALCVDGKPEVGVSYFAAQDLLLQGCTGEQSLEWREKAPLKSCTLSGQASPTNVYVRGFENVELPEWCTTDPLDSGEALRRVASGELDGVVLRLGRLQQWDVAAPHAILSAAGATITDETGRQICFGLDSFSYRYFVATNGRIHEEVLSLFTI